MVGQYVQQVFVVVDGQGVDIKFVYVLCGVMQVFLRLDGVYVGGYDFGDLGYGVFLLMGCWWVGKVGVGCLGVFVGSLGECWVNGRIDKLVVV